MVGTFRNPARLHNTIVFLSLLIFYYGMRSKAAWARLWGLFTIGVALCVFLSLSREEAGWVARWCCSV